MVTLKSKTTTSVILAVLAFVFTAQAESISFRNDVQAVLSKAGCNAGTCHGNKYGKGAFKLSLRGQDPDLDTLAVRQDSFARRINTFEPEQSLLLLKATTQVPHEGGQRFARNSPEYKILREWIAAGAHDDPAATPKLVKIKVAPTEKVILGPANQVQITATATFSDGSSRDITSLAVYEPANTLVKVSHDGLVQKDQDGETTVLVRYLHIQEPVRLAFVPARPEFKWSAVPENNYIDRHIFSKLRTLRMNPSSLCTDNIYLRRAYLDLLGVLPTEGEAQAFLQDKHRDKRSRLVSQLLERPEYADFWSLKWADLLRNEEKALDRKGIQVFQHWIRQSIAENKPLDQFVHQIVAARGSTYLNPAANFYRAVRDPSQRAESIAQVFLGVRLQCAQCHNHPFDRWSQDDYYNWGTVFSRVSYKVLENKRRDDLDKHEFNGEQVVYAARTGEMNNARTGKPATPRLLGSSAPVSDQDRLDDLAEWLTSPQNPLFARAQVNRIWYNVMGRGLVDPIDDFRPTNPASHPALLDALTKDFIAHKFDVRYLITLIMNSRAYQLSSEPMTTNSDDEINYSHTLPRRLSAEQLFDSQHQILGVPARFSGYPEGLRAAQLPGGTPVRRAELKASSPEMFLNVFGKPARLLTCECERAGGTTMSQAFQLISGPAVQDLLTTPDNQLGRLLEGKKSHLEIINDLYWRALTRPPSQKEIDAALAHLEKSKDARSGLEDVTWSLLNAKEFILRQ
ncbi:MAG: hypothetical protein JWM16_4778 [Verrucomicrobiales bacterium]|nr:hypothetical protein [Verrucomicrobiales bacterium]